MADWMTWDGGAFTADVVTSIEEELTAEVTEHPIETGSVIADHVIVRPKTVVFEFAQSAQPSRQSDMEWRQVDHPVVESRFDPEGLLAITMAVGGAIDAGLSALGLGSGQSVQLWTLAATDDADRINEVGDVLRGVLADAKTVAFAYGGLVLSGYVLTSVSRSTRAGRGGLATFRIAATHVATVETAISSLLGGLPVPSLLDALPMLDMGPKGTDAIEESVQEHLSHNAEEFGINLKGGSI